MVMHYTFIMEIKRRPSLRSGFIGLGILVLGLVIGLMVSQSDGAINSFSSCKDAGYQIAESQPRQCFTPDGKVFVEDSGQTLGLNEQLAPNGFSKVTIYFQRNPKSSTQYAYTEGVERLTNDSSDLIKFALDELIRGPEPSEKDQGYYSAIELSGDSNCGGDDYFFTVNESGTATINFCRDLNWRGGNATRILASISRTIPGLGGAKSVIVKTADGTVLKP
jgi:hypothetical protein